MKWDIIQMRMIITIKSDTTPPPTIYWQNPHVLLPHLQVYVTLLVMPECVRVEEGFAAEGAHQPHSQVYPTHVSANGSIRGWWALPATLNLTSVHSFDAPQLNMKGLHVSRDLSLSKTEGVSWRGRFQCLLCRNRGFRFLGLLRGQMGNGGGRGMASLLRRRWGCG